MAWNKTVAESVLQRLGDERRRVVADWRIAVYARKIAEQEGAARPDLLKCKKIIDHLQRSRLLRRFEGVQGVFEVVTPYANVLPIADEHIVQEANPLSVLSHSTAMFYHGLLIDPSRVLHAVVSRIRDTGHRIPLGTTPEDWSEFDYCPKRTPVMVNNISVMWHRISDDLQRGIMVGAIHSLPVYVTDIDRTLIDCLSDPNNGGGIAQVLRAWRTAINALNIDRVIEYAEMSGSALLRQRVGYVLEQIGASHDRLREWQLRVKRGGSMRLVAGNPYGDAYSERWGIALNVPEAYLEGLKER